MFKLWNDYSIEKLLRKVQWNARIMFIVYGIFIFIGIISAILIMRKDNFWLLMPIFMGICLILISPFLIYDYFKNKQNIYSIYTLRKLDSDIVRILDQKVKKSEKICDRLGISNEYIFSLKSTFYIPFAIPIDTINTIYFKRAFGQSWSWGNRSLKPNIYIITKVGKHYKLPLGGKIFFMSHNKPLDTWILKRIHIHAPKIKLGYKDLWNKNLEYFEI